ncbi:FadR/GntR family transcriptional regulator [Arthrobacter globiformis]|uniref:FadR/GntR family transcriptional regulator n=1 Tax=Arthrobacter globiformis TaxID=1665 RepID=UPI0027941A36|nr:FCD domain-containing protein [Arthrobacter globiformis]MDQ0616063.1 GntR family transcriptional repressor for pyruvate dehydrogenase complex [Arthrobacter globiformis]
MGSAAISTSALDLLLLLRGSEPEGLGRADQVSYQIETAILMGILTEGDRLPTESVLAAELGISPITLRQSLAALRTKGLIETSRGRSGGSVIRRQLDFTDSQLQDKLRETSTEALRDLGDLGAAIASMSARLAAGRADPKNVEHLEDLARRHRDSADDRARRRMDSRFHVAVSIAAQSSRLTSAALQLEAEVMTLWWGRSGQAGSDGKSVEEHAAIVDAIRARDSDAAASAAERHSRNETEHLIEQHLRLTMRPEEGA